MNAATFVRAGLALLALALTLAGARGAEAPPAGRDAILEDDHLKVWLDPAFPRVLRYQDKRTGAEFGGASLPGTGAVEINGKAFRAARDEASATDQSYHLSTRLAGDSAVYTFQFHQRERVLSLALAFRLESEALRMALQDVVEPAGFSLETLYFPKHDLLSDGAGPAGASLCRAEFSRNNKGVIKTGEVFKGAIQRLAPDASPQQTHWAFVYTYKAVALLENNIPIFPIHTLASGRPGSATRVALWNAVYHHRVQGEKMPPLECRIRFVGDLNDDKRIDWMDGAMSLRAKLPDLAPVYREAFLYKIQCCRLPDSRFPETVRNAPRPTVYATFDQCLDIIRTLSNLTHGSPQIVYLVGWQHQGHDDKYPDLSVVNPHLGGKDKLMALMEAARKYNATVSLHVNCDEAYQDSPSWDPEILCREAGGKISPWGVQHGQSGYHISHFKDVKKGSALKRIDDLMRMLPIQETIHYDAFRYTNESWDPAGPIDMTAELVLGVNKIIDAYARRGISITIEGFSANPALLGRMQGSWHLYTKDEFYPFLLHRKWVGGGSSDPEAVAFGASAITHFDHASTPRDLCDAYYLAALPSRFLRHYDMTRVTDDGKVLRVDYGKSCRAEYVRKPGEFRLSSGGILLARGDDRFVPVGERELLAYSRHGGAMVWTLPPAWRGQGLRLVMLTPAGTENVTPFQVEPGGAIRFQAAPQQPYLLAVVPK